MTKVRRAARASMRILGIDPGLSLTGYACVEVGRSREPQLLEAGVLRLKAGAAIPFRLRQLHQDLDEIIAELLPDRVAVEEVFAHGRNLRTTLVMAHARGVVLLAAERHSLVLDELSATAVKKAITGRGHADKRQIQLAVMGQCRLAAPPSPPDVADAIAIALTSARRLG